VCHDGGAVEHVHAVVGLRRRYGHAQTVRVCDVRA
jgi:hypothetical protein